MFAEAWILLGLIGGAVVLVSFFSWRQKRRLRNGTNKYRWKPEQDFDVIQEGEANMTPAFPKLLKRKKPVTKI